MERNGGKEKVAASSANNARFEPVRQGSQKSEGGKPEVLRVILMFYSMAMGLHNFISNTVITYWRTSLNSQFRFVSKKQEHTQ